jgi:hypothetical protein
VELLADTHLHLYPCYSFDQAFSLLLDRLAEKNPQAVFAACLAERADCHVYNLLLAGKAALKDFTMEQADRQQLVLRRSSDGRVLHLLPGRQIVAAERIEVLALCTAELFADGLPAAELIRSIQEKNGVPVLPWSPGKWLFQRGKVVAALLRDFTPQDLLLGDVSLRPQGWPLPLLMGRGRRLGYTIISGSDPLPFSGEEKLFGSYGSRLVSAEQHVTPGELLRYLLAGRAETANFGRRSSMLAVLRRLRCNAAASRCAKLLATV